MLPGCGPISDEAQITSVINGFSNAISSQNWDKARGYCVYESEVYNSVDEFENFMDPVDPMVENVTIEYSINISNIIVTGNYATVDGFTTFIITIDGESSGNIGGELTMNLKKVDNSWKLFSFI
jgi:hypothetical protein